MRAPKKHASEALFWVIAVCLEEEFAGHPGAHSKRDPGSADSGCICGSVCIYDGSNTWYWSINRYGTKRGGFCSYFVFGCNKHPPPATATAATQRQHLIFMSLSLRETNALLTPPSVVLVVLVGACVGVSCLHRATGGMWGGSRRTWYRRSCRTG